MGNFCIIGCGQDRLEFQLGKDGYIRSTAWPKMCIIAVGGAKSGAEVSKLY